MFTRSLRLPAAGTETFFDQPRVGRRLVVCLEPKPRRTDEGIEILPATELVAELGSGKLFGDA